MSIILHHALCHGRKEAAVGDDFLLAFAQSRGNCEGVATGSVADEQAAVAQNGVGKIVGFQGVARFDGVVVVGVHKEERNDAEVDEVGGGCVRRFSR